MKFHVYKKYLKKMIMDRFSKFIPIILRNEGGYVNNPNDSGGETKYGISKRSYPNVDIKNLTVEKASEIYKEVYYDACKCDLINSELLSLQMFDWAVTSGVSRAIKALQKIVGTTQDGVIGEHTLAEVNKADFSSQYIQAREAFYKSIGVGKNLEFLKGWLKRVTNTSKAIK